MKTKKVNVKSAQLNAFLEGQLKQEKILEYGEGETLLQVRVNPLLPFSERAKMVRQIADMVFVGDDQTVASYAPEYTKLAKTLAVIQFYTDFKLPKELNSAWLFINYTSLYDDTVDYVGTEEINAIFAEADMAINSRLRYLENKTDLNLLFSKILKGVEALGTQFENVNVNDLVETLKKLPQNSTEDLVGAILKTKGTDNNKSE